MLRIPYGCVVVGPRWFEDSYIEKVFIPNTVITVKCYAFHNCTRLREVVFEPNSRLVDIDMYCFDNCGLEEVVIPKNVRSISLGAFQNCRNLRSLTFEEGSQLIYVGMDVLKNALLDKKEVKFPNIR